MINYMLVKMKLEDMSSLLAVNCQQLKLLKA